MNLKLKDFDDDNFAKGGISQGGRHKAAVVYANDLLFKVGVDHHTLQFEMERWNKTCKPPMDQKEIQRVIDDCYKYFQKKSGEKK